jgi:hypothetical protein
MSYARNVRILRQRYLPHSTIIPSSDTAYEAIFIYGRWRRARASSMEHSSEQAEEERLSV